MRERCGEWQALTWAENVDLTRGIRVCRACRQGPLDVAQGEWVASHPGRSTRGYHVTKLILPDNAIVPTLIKAFEEQVCLTGARCSSTAISASRGRPRARGWTPAMIGRRAARLPAGDLPTSVPQPGDDGRRRRVGPRAERVDHRADLRDAGPHAVRPDGRQLR